MSLLSKFLLSISAFLLLSVGGSVYASSVREYIEGYDDKFLYYDEGPGARVIPLDEEGNISSQNIFEVPTVKALSLLFWAVDLYKVEDDKAVDLFAFTNECAIYKKYHSDEIEWGNIREATRQYLLANKEDFPTRFEFPIPLKLKDYDKRKGVFMLQDQYQIASVRRFEVFASDFSAIPCIDTRSKATVYPRSIVLEFSRPLSLTGIAIPHDVANDYIKRKLNIAKSKGYGETPHAGLVYDTRNALLVLKVKVFTHGRFLGVNAYDLNSVQMLAVLEGYDIYDDISRERLLFSQNYISNTNKNVLYVGLKEQIELIREKAAGKGILH